mmetsp:Transcript_142843/g.456485  ORF Transcript_142843/g.456485 Transcript_142843/m.456485 type:complete len:228 (-) Transcript_142843:2492-3175(-)
MFVAALTRDRRNKRNATVIQFLKVVRAHDGHPCIAVQPRQEPDEIICKPRRLRTWCGIVPPEHISIRRTLLPAQIERRDHDAELTLELKQHQLGMENGVGSLHFHGRKSPLNMPPCRRLTTTRPGEVLHTASEAPWKARDLGCTSLAASIKLTSLDVSESVDRLALGNSCAVWVRSTRLIVSLPRRRGIRWERFLFWAATNTAWLGSFPMPVVYTPRRRCAGDTISP